MIFSPVYENNENVYIYIYIYIYTYICIMYTYVYIYIFYVGFLSRTFTIHRTTGEGGGYPFNSSLPFPPASQTLRQ